MTVLIDAGLLPVVGHSRRGFSGRPFMIEYE